MGSVAIAPLLAVAVLLAITGLVLLQRRHQAGLVGRLTSTVDDTSDILHFTGVACTICHVAQRPALARLQASRADIRVREVDVADEPEVARRYRVMTLPTTVVLDRQRRIVAINAGFAGESLLSQQVDAARQGTARATVA